MMHRNLLVQNMAKKYNFAKRECLNFYNANKKLEVENQFMRHKLKVAIFGSFIFVGDFDAKRIFFYLNINQFAVFGL